MSDFIDSKKVRARKEHKCHLCSTKIEKKEFYIMHSGRWEGEWFNNRLHETCDEHIRDYLNHHEETEYTPEFVEEYLFEKYCTECPFLNEDDECELDKNIFRCDDILQKMEDE